MQSYSFLVCIWVGMNQHEVHNLVQSMKLGNEGRGSSLLYKIIIVTFILFQWVSYPKTISLNHVPLSTEKTQCQLWWRWGYATSKALVHPEPSLIIEVVIGTLLPKSTAKASWKNTVYTDYSAPLLCSLHWAICYYTLEVVSHLRAYFC